jgi:peptide-methionine (S)-S-oxide reductase
MGQAPTVSQRGAWFLGASQPKLANSGKWGIIPGQFPPTRMKVLRSLLVSTFVLFAAMSTPAAESKTESLVLGGGCFWCTEAAYEMLPGVKAVVSGYAGGHVANPTYEQIGTKKTGHAEVIKIDYDPAVVSLERLLDYFWHVHNPTQADGQGNDIGPQYRSVILYANPAQKAAAEKSRAAAAKTFRDPIVTELAALEKFWPAEEYHQDYFRRNPNAGYCAYVIAPKVKKLEAQLKAEKK